MKLAVQTGRVILLGYWNVDSWDGLCIYSRNARRILVENRESGSRERRWESKFELYFTYVKQKWGYKVDGTSSGSCQMAESDVRCFEPSDFANTQLIM
jgi:hypothetical protein